MELQALTFLYQVTATPAIILMFLSMPPNALLFFQIIIYFPSNTSTGLQYSETDYT